MKLEFSRQIFEKKKTSRMSFEGETSCSMRTDGRIDMTKLIVAFRNFANAPKELRNTVSQVEELLATSEILNLY
jgi:hypothetical protein